MLDLLESSAEYAGLIDDRRCSRCGEVKAIAEFPVKNKRTGLRSVWCVACRRAYGREHYEKNKPAYLAKSARRRAVERPKVRALIDQYLRDHPCVDCGSSEITVLEFDHRDPSEKALSVGDLARMAEWPRVLQEIRKCDVRCANCHRRRTGEQFGHARVKGVRIDPMVVRPGRAGRYASLNGPRQDALLSDELHGLRRCSRCGELKALYRFPFRNFRDGSRAYYCRGCQAAYRRAHYEMNRPDYVERAVIEVRLKREDALVELFAYLRDHPCIDCGESDIRVLEFDHRDASTKSMAVGQMIGRRSWSAIRTEIAKCDVRCANCHRKRTAAQRAWKCRLAELAERYGRIEMSAGVA